VKWSGSKLDYSKIRLVRVARKKLNHPINTIIIDWDLNYRDITFYLPSWRKIYGIKPSAELIKNVTNLLSHEAIHGVTFHIMLKDRVNCELLPEFPMYNGMDPLYTKQHKSVHK